MEFECSCRHFTNNFEKTASNGMCWCLASCLFQKLSFVHKRLMYLYRPQQAFLMRLENPTTKLSSQVKSAIMTKKKPSSLSQKSISSFRIASKEPSIVGNGKFLTHLYCFVLGYTWFIHVHVFMHLGPPV